MPGRRAATASPAEATSTVLTRPSRRWVLVAAGAALVLLATYWLAVQTVTGQRIENGALRGADQVSGEESFIASAELSSITLLSFAVVSAALVLAAYLRCGAQAAVGVGVVLAAPTAITQTLKRVLPRPELVPVTGDYTGNSFPSGHTTIAMSALFALLLVVPHRRRGVAVVLGAFYSLAIGAQTVIAKWHRLSDTIGADAIALGVTCLVLAWLARADLLEEVPECRPLRVSLVVVPLGVLVAATLLTGALILILGEVPVTPDPVLDHNVFLASLCLAQAGSGIAALVLWGSVRQMQVPPRRPPAAA